jgi:hypothetical protein
MARGCGLRIFEWLFCGCRCWNFDVFEAAGVTFWSIFDHFGRRWLLVATLQAHLAPEARKVAYFTKNDSKIEASLDPCWVPWAPLGSISEPPGHKLCQKWLEVEICRLRENECFPMVKRYILRVWGAGGAPNGHLRARRGGTWGSKWPPWSTLCAGRIS